MKKLVVCTILISGFLAHGSKPSSSSSQDISPFLDQILPVRGVQNLVLDYLDRWDTVQNIESDGKVYDLAYSPNGKYIAASNGYNGQLEIWSLQDGSYKSIQKFTASSFISHVALTDELLVFVTAHLEIYTYKLIDNKFILQSKSKPWADRNIEGHEASQISLTPDAQYLSIVSDERAELFTRKDNTFVPLYRIPLAGTGFYGAVSSRGYLAFRDIGGGLAIMRFDYKTGELLGIQKEKIAVRHRLHFSPDGGYLIVGTMNGLSILKLNEETGKFVLQEQLVFDISGFLSPMISLNGTYIFALMDKELAIWKRQGKTYIKQDSLKNPFGKTSPIFIGPAISADGSHIAVGGHHKNIFKVFSNPFLALKKRSKDLHTAAKAVDTTSDNIGGYAIT